MSAKEPVTLELLQSRYAGLVAQNLADEFDFGDSTPAQCLEHYNTVLEDLYKRMDREVNGKPDKEKVYNAAVDTYNDVQDLQSKNPNWELPTGGANGNAPEDEDQQEAEPIEKEPPVEEPPVEEPVADPAPTKPKARRKASTPAQTATPKAADKKDAADKEKADKAADKEKAKADRAAAAAIAAEPKELVFQGFERFGLKTMDDVLAYTNPKFGDDGLYVITPGMAAEWLTQYNVRNRQIYKSNWKRLGDAAIGVAGRAWTYNGDRISFFAPWDDPKDEHGYPIVIRARDADGNVKSGKMKMAKNQLVLANAQHRLTFAVEYGVPLITEVVFNLPWLSDNYIDSHQKTRTMKDALVKDGHMNASLLSQTAALLIRIKTKTKGSHLLPTSPWPSVSQGQEFIHKNPALEKYVAAVVDSIFAMKHQPKFWAATMFLLRKQKEGVAEVTAKIVDFAELKKGDPLLVLQSKLTSLEGQKRGGVASMDAYGALILKAIQAKVEGTELPKLAFANNETYPEI